MGYPIFFSDQVSKSILIQNKEVQKQVKLLLGDQAYLSDQEINRKFIANKIFSDDLLLEQMNNIIHPAVRSAFDEWAEKQDSDFVFNEAAILFETEGYLQLDKNILVVAKTETKILRVKERDNISEDEINNRMAKQWNDEQKTGLADYIISNNESDMLLPQIIEILDDLKLILPN